MNVTVQDDTIVVVDIGTVLAYASGGPTDHNNLQSLQGGAHNDYYHLTLAKYNELINGISTVTKAAIDYEVLITDRIVQATTGGITLTLPTAIDNTGFKLVIDNLGILQIIVNTSLSQTINDSLTITIAPNNSMTVYSDGINWRII